ncbi:MAG: zinc-binding alcohol dehydrogenase [Clostridia bacterium]|nr:zinc-binding alcohol dehydrogenase [Clostridia bacterium]MBO4884477.1 zinc-binding alcohol dehydrogenase [Clostridia bacterium]
MLRHRILFPEINKAELVAETLPDEPPAGRVLVRTAYSTVSPGTERANITGNPNVAGQAAPSVRFPRGSGYSSSGVVEKVGEGVTRVKPGDRVIVYWGVHADWNLVPEANTVPIDDERVSLREAAAVFISTFPLAAVRKTRLELGESCMVMGLGLLGQFAVRIARAAGAAPVIAVDPVASRREDALAGGADWALDPFAEGFAARVKELTGGGVNAAIEVTGQGAGLDETLDCMARFGRVALLGCTRDKEFTIDYYRKVHCPGITLIGAHTRARPAIESHAGWFTHEDDIRAMLRLCAGGRIDIAAMLSELHSPGECPQVYDRLINDRNFPMAVQFDWTKEA